MTSSFFSENASKGRDGDFRMKILPDLAGVKRNPRFRETNAHCICFLPTGEGRWGQGNFPCGVWG